LDVNKGAVTNVLRAPALRAFHARPYTESFARPQRPPTSGPAGESFREEAMREAHVPTEHPTAQEAPRLPVPHAHARRSGRDQGPSPARPHAPLGLIRRVRGRATFAALAGAERHARDSITVRCIPGGTPTPPRVAYGVGRAVGGAVARNRVRRRLRAALGECEAQLVPGAAYLVSAGREVLTMPFSQLVDALGQLLRSAGRSAQEDG
jgi:ribonuclease P protein component